MAQSIIETILNNIVKLLADNVIPIVILTSIIVFILFNRYKQMRDPNTRAIRQDWKAIQKNTIRLTDKFFAEIGDLDHPGFGFSGELFLVDSHNYDATIETEEPYFLNPQELEELTNKPADEKPEIFYSDAKQPYAYRIINRIEKRKTDTALAMIPTKYGGDILGIRRSGLRETETILSETQETPLINLDPSMTLGHTRLLTYGVIIFEIIMVYMMLTNADPQLLFSASTWPWYVVMMMAWYAHVRSDRQKIGHKANYRGYMAGEESIRIGNSSSQIIVQKIPVFELKLHYHPAIPTKNFLKGIGKDDIENDVTRDLQRRVMDLSAKNSSLQAQIDQLSEILKHKDKSLVDAMSEHLNSYSDGIIVGYARYHVSEPQNERQQQLQQQKPSGPGALEWYKESKFIIFGLLLLGGLYFILNGLADQLTTIGNGGSLNIFSTNTLLGFVLIIIGLVFVIRLSR